MSPRLPAWWGGLCLCAALGSAATAAPPTTPAVSMGAVSGRVSALRAEYTAAQGDLQASVFAEPLLLKVLDQPDRREAEVMALAPRTLADVASVFRSAAGVCSLLVLHLNVRSCQGDADNPGALVLAIGPMRTGLPGLGSTMRLTLQPGEDTPGYFRARMTAADGPLGTHDLQLTLEAIALDAGNTFLHVHYSQVGSAASTLAARLYLATAGRAKVGFSVVGRDAAGRPLLIDGERAALERNTVRHYLALLAATGAGTRSGPPAARLEASLRAWHALTERHARQLHELDLAEYLHEKTGATSGSVPSGR
ncbi:MAG: hypothetical protein CFE45_04430 [Burkholderiales bacterium PBB5]|nr:MAG: hypothetical protein CFE45_04430 [Burkholderiales bacterium PBB5]